MRILTLATLGLTLASCIYSEAQQVIKPIELGKLPLEVDESSGLAVASDNSFWTHNDRGGKAELYEVSLRGELKRTITLAGISPIDMEDMTQDEVGNLYLADTGNNKQDRHKLKIYKFNVADIENDSVRPEVIEFLLPEKGLEDKCHFDFEAIAWSRDKLYLFSKDRCDEKDNNLMVYTLPDKVGLYTAEFMGEFFWEDPERNIKITGADIGTNGKSLALLSKDAIHFFFGYKKDVFFNGSYRYIPLKESKKEGLVHFDSCDIIITEESSKGESGKIWKLNLCNIDFD